ncbi:MAG TPA: hypothetical protein PLP05_11150, partial [Sedimentisphaerales bacterium]|nr:hypothetical protein [Sedimentisphaerales bacterium]
TEEEIADYTAVIGMADATSELKAKAYGNIGFIMFEKYDDIASLLENTEKALGICDDYVWRYNLGLAKLFLGEPSEAIKLCLPAIEECVHQYNIDGALELLKAKRRLLPETSRVAYDEIVRRLKEKKI